MWVIIAIIVFLFVTKRVRLEKKVNTERMTDEEIAMYKNNLSPDKLAEVENQIKKYNVTFEKTVDKERGMMRVFLRIVDEKKVDEYLADNNIEKNKLSTVNVVGRSMYLVKKEE